MRPCLMVDLSERTYPIFIGEGLLGRIEEWLPLDLHGRRAFIVSDEIVAPLYAEAFSEKPFPFNERCFLKSSSGGGGDEVLLAA
jgi:3-dehydroquinate synthase